MRKVIQFATLALLLCALPRLSFGQSTTNTSALDPIDLKYALDLLGVEAFKFPIASTAPGYYVNYVIEECLDTAVVGRFDKLSELKKVSGTNLKTAMKPLLASSDTNLFRTFIYHDPEGPLLLHFYYSEYRAGMEATHFEHDLYAPIESRSFNYQMPQPGKRVPAMVLYAQKKGTTPINFPVNPSPTDLRKGYPYTLIVFLELVKL